MSTRAVAVGFGVACAFLVLLRICWAIPQTFSGDLLESHVVEWSLSPTGWQRLAWQLLLALVALGGVARLLGPPAQDTAPALSSATPRQVGAAALVAVCATFALGASASPFRWGFLLAAALALALHRVPPGALRARGLARLVAPALALALLAWLVVGLLVPPVIRDPGELAEVELHQAMTVLPGLQWASGDALLRTNYGPGMSVFVALSSRGLLALGVPARSILVAVVRLAQLLDLALLAAALRLLLPRRWPLALALALAVSAPLWPLDASVLFPNQSGLRYLPAIVGLLLLAWASRQAEPPTLRLALGGALLAAWSIELGVATCLALGTWVLLMARRTSPTPRGALREAAKFTVACIACFLPLAYLAWGLVEGAQRSALSFFLLFAGGYGSEAALPSVFAVLVVFFGAAAFAAGVERARGKRLSRLVAFQAAVGMLMLAWLPYYVNRMREWNLWFHAVLVVMLFSPRLHLVVRALRSPRRSVVVLIATATVGGLLGVSVRHLGAQLDALAAATDAPCRAALGSVEPCVPGVAGELRAALREGLSAVPQPTDVLVLSLLSTEVRLAGFNASFPWYDAFGELQRARELSATAAWIDQHGPAQVIIESDQSALGAAMPTRVAHLAAVGRQLTRYRLTSTGGPWLVYARLGTAP